MFGCRETEGSSQTKNEVTPKPTSALWLLDSYPEAEERNFAGEALIPAAPGPFSLVFRVGTFRFGVVSSMFMFYTDDSSNFMFWGSKLHRLACRVLVETFG